MDTFKTLTPTGIASRTSGLLQVLLSLLACLMCLCALIAAGAVCWQWLTYLFSEWPGYGLHPIWRTGHPMGVLVAR